MSIPAGEPSPRTTPPSDAQASARQLLARIPFLSASEDVRITKLKRGITNRNFKVEAGDKAYVLRIIGENSELLGISRNVEYASDLAAGRLGVAPEVLYFIQPEGYLLTRFIDGSRIPPEEMGEGDNIRRVARRLRPYHKLAPPVEGEFNVFHRVEYLAQVSRQRGCTFPFDFDWIMGKMKQVEAALRKDPYQPTPCHYDLPNLNFLDEHVAGGKHELRILDWEHAGMGGIFLDLTNFCHHRRFNDEQANILLQEYLSELAPKAFASLKLMWPMSEVHEAMWGTMQTGISKLDEDFQGYADLWFARMREDTTDPRRKRWLRDVAKS